MKYFLDTEFHENFHKPLFGRKRHYIDLISIGIYAEDGRQYYAVSSDFCLKSAWKNDWLRDNVLKKIHADLCKGESIYGKTYYPDLFEDFTYDCFKTLIKWHGKSNKQISEEIKMFVYQDGLFSNGKIEAKQDEIEFYAYYADYDWVAFCSIFGRMIDLPKGFPMYCRDLKQSLDDKVSKYLFDTEKKVAGRTREASTLAIIKNKENYPKQTNEHNALADAQWNYELYKFLQTI